MDGHPIENLMKTAMESIKDMVNVNTIIGDAVETPDGNVIIPVSRVTFGFAAGGSELPLKNGQDKDKNQEPQKMPFGGGSGAGVSVQPVAFMVVGQGQVRLLPVHQNAMWERVIDAAPQILDQLKAVLKKNQEPIVVQPK
ncbi:GerW family sporulation protein [Thermosediminibacter litoriperuensis]|uniref:Sporulation protein YtfJ n=1 Tax=Thermosediminibacter litoriperuensis TaxID=291989 RepID=A0A5S5B003_9FIRM|nr:GerW family sporulation protein [Thermosediminibacter litoriperuensis]TYP59888.1 sporulation protein YtfJ [Thermosediminibacter litoriperuensis]